MFLKMTIFFNHFNPIALRTAKIAYNFGLSECNRVNNFVMAFLKVTLFCDHLNPIALKRPKFHTILAFLSAIGLIVLS